MAKYDIIQTKRLKFARFGGLSSVNQEGYVANGGTFHSPPATRGFYCFVWPYYELFLLGGNWTAWPWVVGSKFSYIRDKNGKIVTDKHPDYATYISPNKVFQIPTKNWNKNSDARPNYDVEISEAERDRIDAALDKDWEDNHKDEPRWMYAIRPSPKIFEHTGVIWHHLGECLKHHQILMRHGDWVKTSTEDHRLALEKEMHKSRKDAIGGFGSGQKVKSPMKDAPSAKSPFRYGSKDHLECFIEKI